MCRRPPRAARLPSPANRCGVGAQPADEALPAVRVVLDVLGSFLVRPVDGVETALHDLQARAAFFGLKDELDQQRVVVAHDEARLAYPTERKAARRFHSL